MCRAICRWGDRSYTPFCLGAGYGLRHIAGSVVSTRVNASIAARLYSGPYGRFPDRFRIEKVLSTFAQQENMLVRSVAAITGPVRHGIWFVPDYLLAQNPPVVLQCKGHPPRDTDKLFCLTVTIAKIQPQSTIVAQGPAYLTQQCTEPSGIDFNVSRQSPISGQ